MSSASASSSPDSLFCWEQIAKTNRLFRISRVFAPRAAAPGLLPLYALFSSIEQLCCDISDEEVALKKLNWWRAECLHQDPATSNHPILRAMQHSGAAEKLSRDRIAQLFDGAESRLDAAAPVTLEELESICRAVSEPMLALETSVCGYGNLDAHIFARLAVQNGLVQLIREGGRWWLPLNLLARHGVSRADDSGPARQGALRALYAELPGIGSKWRGARIDWQDARAEERSALRHLFVISGLYARKLQRLDGCTPAEFAQEINSPRLPDLFEAWKVARQFSRL